MYEILTVHLELLRARLPQAVNLLVKILFRLLSVLMPPCLHSGAFGSLVGLRATPPVYLDQPGIENCNEVLDRTKRPQQQCRLKETPSVR